MELVGGLMAGDGAYCKPRERFAAILWAGGGFSVTKRNNPVE